MGDNVEEGRIGKIITKIEQAIQREFLHKENKLKIIDSEQDFQGLLRPKINVKIAYYKVRNRNY